MMSQQRVVVVKHLPEAFTGRQRSHFFCEIKNCLDVDRPCLVLDCSRLERIDKHTILLLLCCLEEAMKRNGDVRLAGISHEARAALKAAEADILFQFFDTTADAVASFRRRATAFPLRDHTRDTSESAA